MSILAINGGKPVRNKPISPWPLYDEREKNYLLNVLESRNWGRTSGSVNEEFENRFSEFQKVKHAVTVCNGTVALRIALFAAEIGPGDEVIVPSYTFIATATAVIESNAVPIFADIEEADFNISPDCVERLITDRTKAIIPVHFGGASPNMDRIIEIAKKHSLKVIEDAAQAQGAEWNNIPVGNFGDVGTFSFQLSKNMTSGEGGAIITNNDHIAERARTFHNCGRQSGYPWYFHFGMGGNFRLSEIQAAVLMAQLEREKDHLTKRRESAKYLVELLKSVDGIEPVIYSTRVKSSYYLFIAKYNKEEFGNIPKKKFVEALNAEGIATLEGYPYPLYRQPVFVERKFWNRGCPIQCPVYGGDVDYSKVHHPVAEKACEMGFWFPNLVLHGDKKDTESIVEAIIKVKKYSHELSGDGKK